MTSRRDWKSKSLLELASVVVLIVATCRVENQLATVLAASRPTSPTSPAETVSPTATTDSVTLGARVLSHLAAAGNLGGEEREKKEEQGREIMGWTALGGYCIAASIGIGVSLYLTNPSMAYD